MQPAVLQALEFNRIVEAVCGFAATPLGAARLDALRPSTDPRRVGQWQAATTETARYIELNGTFPLTATHDLGAILGSLAIEGRGLEPLRLLALSDYLDSVEATRAGIRRAETGFPILKSIVEGSSAFRSESAEVRHKIDPSGEVLDDASPGIAEHAGPPAPPADAAARHDGVLPPEQGHVEVPAGSDRDGSERPARAGRPGRAPDVDPGHSARQFRQRRQPVPGAARVRSRSTTTSSRWSSRRPKRSGASCCT